MAEAGERLRHDRPQVPRRNLAGMNTIRKPECGDHFLARSNSRLRSHSRARSNRRARSTMRPVLNEAGDHLSLGHSYASIASGYAPLPAVTGQSRSGCYHPATIAELCN